MQRINVARRAQLGLTVNNKHSSALTTLDTAGAYNKTVIEAIKSDKTATKFHYANYLNGITSILDAYLTDVLKEYITCYPGHSGEKNIKFDIISNSGSLASLAYYLAEKRVNELSYKKFSEFHSEFSSIISLDGKLDNELLSEISEIKATRDIYVHASGVCNEIYLNKSGEKARGRIGNELLLDVDYINFCEKRIKTYLLDLHKVIPERIKSYAKVQAFREMWELSELVNIKEFDEVWDSNEESDMCRPKDEAFEYGWSGSEKAALDFFLGVYSTQYPKRDTDLMYAMERWPPSTGVGQVIISWMEAPFWF